MNKDADELRAEIAQTREELRNDVDAIVDKASPTRIAHRQSEKFKNSVTKVKESVMGSGESVSDHTQRLTQETSEAVHDAPHKVADKTRGNPLAAGLIAFGAGLLASSLIPSTRAEAELVQKAKDKAEPLASELGEAAKKIASDLKEPVTAAAEELKNSSMQSMERVKSEASGETERLQQEAKGSMDEYKN
ncbi:DUF3618 domain-containing protein [Glutamicibacter sp.]|jgi:Protein of unknown function (DUF3618).|uniref:DUF3618 domain-containing protein n=1 Tax=Glutamicibacter sp. TaxID=1931995 RepID=UPI002B476D8B|nr:DUF3618 domain-containing protein [Glutamicibacter sp.]HJX78282.1 DUF3618 domain-containing protein [Glutamicibacter sp.]